ncbi:relaxase/mobilization nuclease domain-containing protein [Flavobacterium psychroterrae]|uniref:Relaxase/mobilization nuclease domain-containing protein n=1 Tax=Flavobacterium psychroterrae TaxID=2133767 RepID=A0ABS5PKY5_9FLAO|nr:relaxase/mobilization nuclease domain-containing protein [Flavobacterium psychroterrae]MBS7234111.1 relaxase/mobilization nuclease domain-containing protein [Flavobacterium psychroterrae]
MVAVIKTGHSIHRIVHYNESKVKAGAAVCIGAGNYPVDAAKMTVDMKLNRFLKVLELNENVQRNSVHISLNFDPSEKFSKEKLMEIADSYMDKIGFGKQLYLVYEHTDAGHPHIHLATINIERDGKRIDLHHLAIRKSEPARKEIEKTFGLIPAQGRRTRPDYVLEPISTARVQYGKMQSKKAISNVLDKVLFSYKYTSLAELNAVLGLYNVLADRGSENSRVFQAGGLVYRILDQAGKHIGVPIKASDFYSRPTLLFLQQRFVVNAGAFSSEKKRIKNAIDLAFLKNRPSFAELLKGLQKQGIHVVLRKSEQGKLYGITYVDHTTKCVFNGSVLGKNYSAKAMEERCGLQEHSLKDRLVSAAEKAVVGKAQQHDGTGLEKQDLYPDQQPPLALGAGVVGKGLDVLLQAEGQPEYVPKELKGRRKKRKRKGQSE